jgi:hypothetical protein
MTRYSGKARDEVPQKRSDEGQRRTRPADVGPASPKKIADIYAKGKETISRKEWLHEEHQANQFPEDKHQDNGRGRYDNDVPRDRWARGGDLSGDGRPGFDRGKFDIANKPQKPTGPRNTASGTDIKASPFSAAHKTWKD